MRTRTVSAVWIIAPALVLASADLAAQRGRAETARTVAPTAVQQAERAIDKAAAARGILLTDAARQALAKEAVRQEATAPAAEPGPVSGALSEDKLSRLLTPLAGAGPGTRLDAADVQTRVVDAKTRQVIATLPADIAAHEQATGQRVPDAVRQKMTEDLSTQSEALSKSGLGVDAIRERNAATLQALNRASGGRPLTPETYPQVMAQIFTVQVNLSIGSTPGGAEVSVQGASIGQTDITNKPFKPGPYTFTFKLKGYQDASREFYVTPGEGTDSFTEALTPVGAPAAPGTPEPAGPTPSGSAGFSWMYVALGGVIVVLLVALVARRR